MGCFHLLGDLLDSHAFIRKVAHQYLKKYVISFHASKRLDHQFVADHFCFVIALIGMTIPTKPSFFWYNIFCETHSYIAHCCGPASKEEHQRLVGFGHKVPRYNTMAVFPVFPAPSKWTANPLSLTSSPENLALTKGPEKNPEL